jgi:hypothetical protein
MNTDTITAKHDQFEAEILVDHTIHLHIVYQPLFVINRYKQHNHKLRGQTYIQQT